MPVFGVSQNNTCGADFERLPFKPYRSFISPQLSSGQAYEDITVDPFPVTFQGYTYEGKISFLVKTGSWKYREVSHWVITHTAPVLKVVVDWFMECFVLYVMDLHLIIVFPFLWFYGIMISAAITLVALGHIAYNAASETKRPVVLGMI